jgi:hypothetical protein
MTPTLKFNHPVAEDTSGQDSRYCSAPNSTLSTVHTLLTNTMIDCFILRNTNRSAG